MQMTGQSWADRRAAAEQNSGNLPDIGGHKNRVPMGESFQSMGRMTGAAGFNRDSAGGRGVPDPGLTGFSYNAPSERGMAGNTQTSTFGMNKPTED